jgi:hypothetical protein
MVTSLLTTAGNDKTPVIGRFLPIAVQRGFYDQGFADEVRHLAVALRQARAGLSSSSIEIQKPRFGGAFSFGTWKKN